MQKWIDKADNLSETLPYIRRFHGKIMVIKYGGSVQSDAVHLQNIMEDIAWLFFCGIKPVVVHGGGVEISQLCQQLQIPIQFSQGQRVTDSNTLEAVQMALLGKVNAGLVTALCQQGVKAVGLSGRDANFLQAKKLLHDHQDLGWVGEITQVEIHLLETLIQQGFVPIIAPLAVDAQANIYNVNADTAAAAIASALRAEKLVLLSDVNGIYADKNKPETRVSTLNAATLMSWIASQQINEGMIPKVNACIQALNAGVSKVHILDGKIRRSLLLEIFTHEGIGTMITQQ